LNKKINQENWFYIFANLALENMIFTKKANILQILLLLLVLSSWTKEYKAKAVLKKPIETALIQQGPKLTAAYIKSKKNSILHYYNKTSSKVPMAVSRSKKWPDYLWKYEGLANYKEKSAITSATPIHIASVSKVVTATAILKLVGWKLYLDQKVNTILKEFPILM
jgi:hypothetical protein